MLATNNGSVPRRVPRTEGTEPQEVLDRIAGEAIDDQIRAGLDLVTDGLVRRKDPVDHVVGHLEGVVLGEGRSGFPGSGVSYSTPLVSAEIFWKKPILVEDFLFAKAGSPKPVKPILCGPYTLSRVAEDRAYNDPMAMAMGFAIALNAELKALQAAGATWAQIDEPSLLDAKADYPTFTRLWEVLGRGVKLSLCLHLEGGDILGLYPGLTGLKRLACLSLDCVRGKSSLDLLAKSPFPETVMLGLGLIDGRSARIETPEEIAAILRATSGLPSAEKILLGTASDLGGLPHEVALAKLQALAGARDMF